MRGSPVAEAQAVRRRPWADPRWVIGAAAALWGAALAWSAAAGRVLYADGAWYVLVHLFNPHRFNDYDFQRSFASFVSQAPMLFAQRFGAEKVAVYAALYSFGTFWIPAIAMLAALVLARRQPALFAANAFAIVVWGFGTNYINTEANLLFGLVWLAATILALDRPAPILRGFALPLIGLVLLRTYEGMLLVGPILALFAALAAHRAATELERIGLVLAGLLFALGAVIGLGGFLSPRDPANAAGFLSSVPLYLGNPQALLGAAALSAFVAIVFPAPRLRLGAAALSALFGVGYLVAMYRLEGYYAFTIYYNNRGFMVLSLPAFIGALAAVAWRRPRWLAAGPADGFAFLLVPLAFAVAGDMMGTVRWGRYIDAFCEVLASPGSPQERLARLKAAPVQTGWAWINPSMSVLLRERGSNAIVANDPGMYEPFDATRPVRIRERGICAAPLFGATAPDAMDFQLSFVGAKPSASVAEVTGLSSPEAWATWSDGPVVEVRFARPLPRAFDLKVRVATAFGANRGAPVKVRVGGVERAFAVDSEPYETTLRFDDVGEARAITFTIPHPQSPAETGKGADVRKLGLAFVSIAVEPRPQP